MVEPVFESLDQSGEVALELGRPLEGGHKLAIVNRAGLGSSRFMAMHVPRDELAKQLADRRLAGSALEHLPGGVVDLDAGHVVAAFRPRLGGDGMVGADR
jgi:hypothetical protein